MAKGAEMTKGTVLRASGALRHVEHLATLDLEPHIAIPEMLRTLNSVVPGAKTGFFWLNQHGNVVDAYHADVSDPVPSLSDNGDGVRVHLTANDRLLAVLAVHRAAPLVERDRRVFRAAAPSLRRALRNDARVGERFDASPERTGVLTATADGRLVGADAHALLLVAEMDGRPLLGKDIAALHSGERLPSVIAELCHRHTARPGSAIILNRTSRWGAYRAQLFAQHAEQSAASHHVIVISKHLPHRVGLMRTIGTLDLSPRERQVAFQLGIGADASQGAAALGVSIATWRSYVKRVYLRLDVSDRFELFSRLNPPTMQPA
ncbi:helix-turn-helix transcriptional regulator [Sphingomonas sp. RP10(2022)]|uniref:Helix-turn-helix transcriptional regulator n=1 Tax=Sphingomonas liriopis TaxID=2949094 RepID=A0A9X2HUT5_9SPHN|nr:helix-turn-helix transcriptional regulator [Sphingomonas liriopis]MCP3734646.1 helix-turn-helix transcriptional regulator [Sphingomonas liriopis]